VYVSKKQVQEVVIVALLLEQIFSIHTSVVNVIDLTVPKGFVLRHCGPLLGCQEQPIDTLVGGIIT
jgi:hypothetical protein